MAILGMMRAKIFGAAILLGLGVASQAMAQSAADPESPRGFQTGNPLNAAPQSPSGFQASPSDAARTESPRGFQYDGGKRETIWDLFRNSQNPNTAVEVNKYLWFAALDILNFMPIESVDPFSGVIVMGYGTPPGGSRSYRATIYVQDPALDARSIKVALQSRGGGAVPIETQRAIEDAIMTRARQLRIQDAKL